MCGVSCRWNCGLAEACGQRQTLALPKAKFRRCQRLGQLRQGERAPAPAPQRGPASRASASSAGPASLLDSGLEQA